MYMYINFKLLWILEKIFLKVYVKRKIMQFKFWSKFNFICQKKINKQTYKYNQVKKYIEKVHTWQSYRGEKIAHRRYSEILTEIAIQSHA